jgi:hypothetical protein
MITLRKLYSGLRTPTVQGLLTLFYWLLLKTMKARTRFIIMALCLGTIFFLSGCAALLETAATLGEGSMRERDYRDQGFTRHGAERNAFYDQTWNSR